MGNLCSAFLRGMDYILRLIFRRYAALMVEGYDHLLEENDRSEISNNRTSAPEISNVSSNPGNPDNEAHHTVEEPNEIEDEIPSGEDNTEYIRSIVNKFFEVYNLQKEALTKNITEKIFDLCGDVNNVSSENITIKNKSSKERRDYNRSEERQFHHTNKELSSFEKVPKKRTRQDKINALSAALNSADKENDSYLANTTGNVDIADCGEEKILTAGAEISMKGIENLEYHRRKYGTAAPEEILSNRKEVCKSPGSSPRENIDDYSNDGHESDKEHKATSQKHKLPRENFRSSYEVVSPSCDIEDEYARDAEVGKNQKHSLRKISLNKLCSGSHYAVVNDDESIELSDYSKESAPLRVEDGICYREFRYPRLLSGVTVAFEELSDHLSIPNWYKDDPIVCDVVPEGISVPQPSPTPQAECLTFQRSCSGGGIVADATSRKVYLPDLFSSSSSPLSQTYSPSVNTQSSASFGEVRVQTDETSEIFADLINQSAAYDLQLASEEPDKENI